MNLLKETKVLKILVRAESLNASSSVSNGKALANTYTDLPLHLFRIRCIKEFTKNYQTSIKKLPNKY